MDRQYFIIKTIEIERKRKRKNTHTCMHNSRNLGSIDMNKDHSKYHDDSDLLRKKKFLFEVQTCIIDSMKVPICLKESSDS